MEMYVPENGNAETYLIQGAESNSLLTTQLVEQIQTMYNEGTPEFVVDQNLYYPTATNYGYYCTGFESPGEWDDHHRIFGLDGPEVQYSGAQTDSLPFVYYTPSYGYAQSPYNPYNPYIPGAMIGVDAPFVGTQQYYTVPPYQNPVSSPAYIPIVVQSRPDIIPNSSPDPLLDTGVSAGNRHDGRGRKHTLSSTSAAFTMPSQRPASNQTHSFARVSDMPRAIAGSSKQQPVTHGSVTSSSFPGPASSHLLQGRRTPDSIQSIDNVPHGRVLPHHNQLKLGIPSGNGLPDFASTAQLRASVDKVRPKFNYARAQNDVNGSQDALIEQNRGPRINRSENQLAVKAYTTKVGDGNAQGNIIIYTDQYNKDDFPFDYVDAKFFVIKSYSEDDVHKSIKYNVWSSTPNGNKKLENAYEDAQRIAVGKRKGCPIFLFFSVNASGQFCGVAEMIGPVDFHKDMDFWQQDKWSGSFPVKWHIIKDVPNTNFRHIILENNENKPVTNSRDTQEIRFKQGLEMLKIFKNHTTKTSLLDDFLYYENRQKIMQEEKSRLVIKSYESPFFLSSLEPPRKLNFVMDRRPPIEEKIITKQTDAKSLEKPLAISTATVQVLPQKSEDMNHSSTNEKCGADETKVDTSVATLRIGSLTISPKQAESKQTMSAAPPSPADAVVGGTEPVDVVTVGSMPVKVNGYAESPGVFTFGTISLDPRTLQLDKGALGKNGLPR